MSDKKDDSNLAKMMPRSIQIACAMLMVFLIVNVILGMVGVRSLQAEDKDPSNLFFHVTIRLAIAGAMLYGIAVGRRFAWLWGRTLALVGAVLMSYWLITRFPQKEHLMLLDAAQIAALFVLFFSLDRRTSKEHFDLVCPTCGLETGRPADFFFTKARCADCAKEW